MTVLIPIGRVLLVILGDAGDGIDQVGLIGSLVAIPVLATMVLWADRRESFAWREEAST